MPTFTERELKEIYFALMYAYNFSHGTDGHNRLILIAKLAELCTDSSVREMIPVAKGVTERAQENAGNQ